MSGDDDTIILHGPLKYWLKATFLYQISELGNLWGGVIIAALVAGAYAAGKFM